MTKKFYLIIILLIATGMALAQTHGTFLPYYFIKGVVRQGGVPITLQRKVIFYKNDIGRRLQVQTDLSGNYEMNIYEVDYYQDVPVTLEGNVRYRIAVPREGSLTTGTEEVKDLIVEEGHMTLDLNIIEGGGPEIPPEAPTGTMSLFIERAGNDVEITWEARFVSPQVYMLTGDGAGRFASYEGWARVYNGGIDPAYAAQFSTITNGIRHRDQVGRGTPEAYYKGLQAGIDPAAINPETGSSNLASAFAVGKFNIPLISGLSNMAAMPFIPSNPDISSVIGAQLPNGTVLSMRDPTGRWDEVSYAGGWSSALNINPDYGFWINVSSGSPILTLVGNVYPGSRRTITLYGGLNNLLGSAYPIQVDLNSSLLGGTLAAEGGKLSAFADGRWDEPEYRGGAWTSLIYKLKPGKGFWVNMNAPGTRPWNYPRLY